MQSEISLPISSPSVLGAAVESVLVKDGLMARSDPLFRQREGQVQMALAVSEVIESGGHLVVEAGTGIGKTFAYLVPVLLSGERALVSTASKALQDQLFTRDVPRLLDLLGVPARVALLKGRGSYLCLHRLGQARHDTMSQSPHVVRILAKVEEWSHITQSGDLAELAGLDERSPLLTLITSTRDNCLGAQCPSAKECHVNLARRQAMAADLVIVNHHLFFADLVVRESGVAELLPSVRVAVFDEAHQLNDIGVQFLGMQLASGQFMDYSRDALSIGQQHARGFADWTGLSAALDAAINQWIAVSGRPDVQSQRRAWQQLAPEGVDPVGWQHALTGLARACEAVHSAAEHLSGASPDIARLADRGGELLARLAQFEAPCADETVRWMESGAGVRMVQSPMDIADAMREKLVLEEPDTTDEDGWPVASQGPSRAWVFTSATLGLDAQLSWFVDRCGLEGARVLRVASPFDYSRQAGLYVPLDMPSPSDKEHGHAVASLVANAGGILGGRTLVLTTTLRALGVIATALRATLEAHNQALEVLVQGELPKRRLMERFRAGAAQGQHGCVLIASMGFWEGFDAPGEALQLVVIDKLPFPPPGDPLVDARVQQIENAGQQAFTSYALPEAAITLKQGAGRLIRRESDRGILVVCDTRLASRGYGKRLIRVLPPMRRLETPEEFQAALEELAAITKTSTTDPTWP